MVAVLRPARDRIYDDWKQRIVATLVAHVAETLRLSVGRGFGRQAMVPFLQSPLSSCVVSKTCISDNECNVLYKFHDLAPHIMACGTIPCDWMLHTHSKAIQLPGRVYMCRF